MTCGLVKLGISEDYILHSSVPWGSALRFTDSEISTSLRCFLFLFLLLFMTAYCVRMSLMPLPSCSSVQSTLLYLVAGSIAWSLIVDLIHVSLFIIHCTYS